MYETLIERIRPTLKGLPPSRHFPRCTFDQILSTERQLKFSIPLILKECYLNLANGGFGPGYGLLGVPGGNRLDDGDLIECYFELSATCREWESTTFQNRMLPVCGYGCAMYSIVDTESPSNRLRLYREGDLFPQPYGLVEWFEAWLDGRDVTVHEGTERFEKDIVNPFSGKPAKIHGRRKIEGWKPEYPDKDVVG